MSRHPGFPLSFKEPCVKAHAEIEAASTGILSSSHQGVFTALLTHSWLRNGEVMHTTLPLTENDQNFLLKIIHCSALTWKKPHQHNGTASPNTISTRNTTEQSLREEQSPRNFSHVPRKPGYKAQLSPSQPRSPRAGPSVKSRGPRQPEPMEPAAEQGHTQAPPGHQPRGPGCVYSSSMEVCARANTSPPTGNAELYNSIVMYKCESWIIKKAEHRRIDALKLWCWRRLLRVPWMARRSN